MDWASIGVSPSLVGPGKANRGRDWRGAARCGEGCRQQRRGLWLPPLLFREQLRRGRAEPGTAGLGEAGRGKAGLGEGCDSSTEGFGSPCCSLSGAVTARRGMAWRGEVGPGLARRGMARADDLSTEPFGALCWVLWNPVMAGRDLARHGLPRRGCPRPDLERQGMG